MWLRLEDFITIMDYLGFQPSDGTWSISLTKVKNSNAFRGQQIEKMNKTASI